jgi:hypothetical protein
LGTTLAQRAQWRRDVRLDTAELVAATYGMIWGDEPHRSLVIHLEKVRARMRMLGASDDAIELFASLAKDCWRDGKDSIDEPRGPRPDMGPMLNTKILNAFRSAQDALLESVGVK